MLKYKRKHTRVHKASFIKRKKKILCCEEQNCAAADRDKPLSHTAVKAAEEKINFKW